MRPVRSKSRARHEALQRDAADSTPFRPRISSRSQQLARASYRGADRAQRIEMMYLQVRSPSFAWSSVWVRVPCTCGEDLQLRVVLDDVPAGALPLPRVVQRPSVRVEVPCTCGEDLQLRVVLDELALEAHVGDGRLVVRRHQYPRQDSNWQANPVLAAVCPPAKRLGWMAHAPVQKGKRGRCRFGLPTHRLV
jgi:hypothetical protein